jgi:TetR/AcrR family transcriptional regulator, cholesterol catabolism regulator
MTTVRKPPPSRRQRKKIAIRERIVAKGLELFSRQGIADVTVDQIAEAADVGKGTIYNYFPSKEHIVVAFMVNFEREVQKTLPTIPSERALDATLSAFVLRQFRMKERYHSFVRVFLTQMFMHTDQFLPYMVEMQKAIDPPLEKFFGRLQQRGVIRRDIQLRDLIMVFKTIQLGLTALWAVERPPFRGTESTVRQEMKLFCEGLEAKL